MGRVPRRNQQPDARARAYVSPRFPRDRPLEVAPVPQRNAERDWAALLATLDPRSRVGLLILGPTIGECAHLTLSPLAILPDWKYSNRLGRQPV